MHARNIAMIAAVFVTLLTGVILRVILIDPPAATFRTSPGTQFTLVYPDDEDAVPSGSIGVGGKVTLSEGVVEIGFASGVQAIVKAPAEFSLEEDDLVELSQGEIWATVPEAGRGFRVRTPDLEVVDLGTEFAVRCSKSGSDEVHVLSGTVLVSTHGGLDGSIELKAGDSIAGEAGGELVAIPPSDDFVTALPSTPPYLHWSFDGENPFDVRGTYSAADTIESEPVQSDRRAAGERLVLGKQGEGLFFDGRGDHLETDWRGFLGKTPRTFACWVKLFPDDPKGWAMIAEWGRDSANPDSPNGRWRVRVSDDSPDGEAHLRASYGENFINGDTKIADGQWHHIAVADTLRLDSDGTPSLRLYVDGQRQALSLLPEESPFYPASTKAGGTLIFGKPFPDIGAHLHGTIDEVFIFNGILSEEDIQRLMETGKP